MKKIIDGVTYNTSTSTAVARAEWEDDERRTVEGTLFQTRSGAFFLHVITTWAVKDRHGEWEERQKNEFEPMTAEEAHKWVMSGEPEILADGIFPEPPEAVAEAVASATVYLRVPVALKARIEHAAKQAGQSVNVWAMRCLEGCCSADKAVRMGAAVAAANEGLQGRPR